MANLFKKIQQEDNNQLSIESLKRANTFRKSQNITQAINKTSPIVKKKEEAKLSDVFNAQKMFEKTKQSAQVVAEMPEEQQQEELQRLERGSRQYQISEGLQTLKEVTSGLPAGLGNVGALIPESPEAFGHLSRSLERVSRPEQPVDKDKLIELMRKGMEGDEQSRQEALKMMPDPASRQKALLGIGASLVEEPINEYVNKPLGEVISKSYQGAKNLPIISIADQVFQKMTGQKLTELTEKGAIEMIKPLVAKYDQLPQDTKDDMSTLMTALDVVGLGELSKLATTTGKNIIRKAPEVLDDLTMKASNMKNKAMQGIREFSAKEAAAATTEAEAEIKNIVSKITQGSEKDVNSSIRALKQIDLDKVKNYKDLNLNVDSKIKALAEQQDALLSAKKGKIKLSELSKTFEEGGRKVSQNNVEKVLNQFEELYTSIDDPESLLKIQNLKDKAINEGLSAKEINDLARKYNVEFGDKAFSKRTGEALTSVNAKAFENTRKGVKDTAREIIGNKNTELIDKQLSDLYNLKKNTAKVESSVYKLRNKLKEKGILENVGSFAAGLSNKLTGGGLKGFVNFFLESNRGNKIMNFIDIEEALPKSLKRIQTLNKTIDNFKAPLTKIQKESIIKEANSIFNDIQRQAKPPQSLFKPTAKESPYAPQGAKIGGKQTAEMTVEGFTAGERKLLPAGKQPIKANIEKAKAVESKVIEEIKQMAEKNNLPKEIIEEAYNDKKFAIEKLKDKNWMGGASDMSKEIVRENSKKPLLEMAKKRWDYLKLRGNAKTEYGMYIDKPAKEKLENIMKTFKEGTKPTTPLTKQAEEIVSKAKTEQEAIKKGVFETIGKGEDKILISRENKIMGSISESRNDLKQGIEYMVTYNKGLSREAIQNIKKIGGEIRKGDIYHIYFKDNPIKIKSQLEQIIKDRWKLKNTSK